MTITVHLRKRRLVPSRVLALFAEGASVRELAARAYGPPRPTLQALMAWLETDEGRRAVLRIEATLRRAMVREKSER